MDPVEAGIEIGRHGAVEEIDNYLAGRSRFDVTRANGRAGVYDHDWASLRREFASHHFRLPFAALVVIAHLRVGDGSLFISGLDASSDTLGQADTADGAGINNAGTPGFNGGFDDIASAFDIGGVHRPIILEPETIAGGHMKTPIAPFKPGAERGAIGDVALDALVRG